jgi:hypothetical protein
MAPRTSIFAVFAVSAAAVFALVRPRSAGAVEHHFAGSAQFDYLFVPTQPRASARDLALDGFTTEATLKLAVDVSERLSGNVKVCYGCHGFEADMIYFDYRLGDELSVRAGRFSPSFGNFNLRHDPGNHRLSTKPLPYDMGRMLRIREWNMGVLPAPFPDNGVEIGGTHWFGESVQLDYATYAVTGFKGEASGFDLDFRESRVPDLYYVDNNSRPTVGGRLALTLKLGESSDATLGSSGMYGTYDPGNRLTYAILGADLVFRFQRTNLRMEYLVRRQQFDTSDPTRFKYVLPPSGGSFFAKHGAYLELEHPIMKDVDVIGRIDAMYRAGNVAAASTLSRESSVVRWTIGTAIGLERGLKLKASTELWRFSDADGRGRKIELGIHLGLVGTY